MEEKSKKNGTKYTHKSYYVNYSALVGTCACLFNTVLPPKNRVPMYSPRPIVLTEYQAQGFPELEHVAWLGKYGRFSLNGLRVNR